VQRARGGRRSASSFTSDDLARDGAASRYPDLRVPPSVSMARSSRLLRRGAMVVDLASPRGKHRSRCGASSTSMRSGRALGARGANHRRPRQFLAIRRDRGLVLDRLVAISGIFHDLEDPLAASVWTAANWGDETVGGRDQALPRLALSEGIEMLDASPHRPTLNLSWPRSRSRQIDAAASGCFQHAGKPCAGEGSQ